MQTSILAFIIVGLTFTCGITEVGAAPPAPTPSLTQAVVRVSPLPPSPKENYRYSFIKEGDRWIVRSPRYRAEADLYGVSYYPLAEAGLKPPILYFSTQSIVWGERELYRRSPRVPQAEANMLNFSRGLAAVEKLTAVSSGLLHFWVFSGVPNGIKTEQNIAIVMEIKAPVSPSSDDYGLRFGRFYRFSRPVVSDQKGQRLKLQPHWDNGKVTITIPGFFLKSAAFPVSVGPY